MWLLLTWVWRGWFEYFRNGSLPHWQKSLRFTILSEVLWKDQRSCEMPLRCSEMLQNALRHSGTFQDALRGSETICLMLCDILRHSERLWEALRGFERIWDTLVPDISWSTVIECCPHDMPLWCSEMIWGAVGPSETLWDVLDILRHSVMLCDGLRGSERLWVTLRCSEIVSDNLSCSETLWVVMRRSGALWDAQNFS